MLREGLLRTLRRIPAYIAFVGLPLLSSDCRTFFDFSSVKLFTPSTLHYEEIKPPENFRLWWEEISNCSGLSGDFSRVHWFHVKEKYIPCRYKTGICNGIWDFPHSVYLANRVFERLNEDTLSENFHDAKSLVEHEMLHDLLNGRKDHPSVFYSCNVMKVF